VSFSTSFGVVQAVRDVSFQLSQGQTIAIVGESGSGKSATAQSILRILPKNAKLHGEILWNGKNLLDCSEAEMESVRGREIGMVFQDPMTALNPTMKIGHQIAESLVRHQRLSRREALEAAEELLRSVGIADPHRRVHSYPHEFSGGMRQRVVIAIAIACSPQLLIADEPTTALDVTVQAQILDLLKDLQEKLQMGLLLITHDLAVVSEVADVVAVMYAGKIIEFGPVREVLDNPVHPYTKGLLNSRPIPGRRHPLRPIPGNPPDLLNPPAGCPFVTRCPFAMRICKHHMPPVFDMDGRNVSCWLLHPQAKGGEAWNSYRYAN
jgi:oligopeptide transport system ATP-binding protein